MVKRWLHHRYGPLRQLQLAGDAYAVLKFHDAEIQPGLVNTRRQVMDAGVGQQRHSSFQRFLRKRPAAAAVAHKALGMGQFAALFAAIST